MNTHLRVELMLTDRLLKLLPSLLLVSRVVVRRLYHQQQSMKFYQGYGELGGR